MFDCWCMPAQAKPEHLGLHTNATGLAPSLKPPKSKLQCSPPFKLASVASHSPPPGPCLAHGAQRAAAAAGGCKLRAIVCESRPLNEGLALANALAAAGVECMVITDAQAGLFMKQADLVLVGADSLTQHEVVNKASGSPGWRGRC